MFNTRIYRLSIALLVGVLAGCSASQASDDYPLTEDQVNEMVEIERTPAQEVFFDDGVITTAERERAFLNFVECAEVDGVTIRDWKLDEVGGDSFAVDDEEDAVAEPDGPRSATNSEKVVQDCRTEHYTAINVWWSYYHRRTGEELEAYVDSVADCLRNAGNDVPDGASEEQMETIDHGAYISCSIEASGS